jgi:hypothetical protein
MSSSPTKLFKLDAIGQARVWNYEKPTLVKESRYTDKLPTNSSETFSHMFYDNYPALKNLDMQNVVFKGELIFVRKNNFLTLLQATRELILPQIFGYSKF